MHYIDSATGARYSLDEPRWRGDAGAHLNLGDARGLRRAEIDTAANSLWRYRRALMVEAKNAVTLGEGWTPLVSGQWDGLPLALKLDYLMPSGSFKDRGMTVMVSYLRGRGLRHLLEDSSGNAGAALAAYACWAAASARNQRT